MSIPPRETHCRICTAPIPEERWPNAVTCGAECQKENRRRLVNRASKAYYERRRANRLASADAG